MGIGTKGRRKVTYLDEVFVWYVAEDDDGIYDVLHVSSESKDFLIKYPLAQLTELEQYLVVLGKRFEGADTGGPWVRFFCPKIDHTGSITPNGVLKIIQWCLSEKEDLRRYTFSGMPRAI